MEVVGPRGRTGPLGGRHRALVAALSLQPGAVVPTWRLVEALWGDRPPRTALRSLHSHVARLRLVLEGCGLDGVLQTREPGYVFHVEPETVDAGRFEREVRSIRSGLASGSLTGTTESFSAALSLWRGPALADAEPKGWTAAEAVRLEGLRSAVLADRCETMLALGRFGEALGEAERLLHEDPLRERLVGLHMIALWGCGRPADALAGYQRLRAALADELGVDPSRELEDLHTSMLRGSTAAAQMRAPGSVIGTSSITVAAAARPVQLPAPVGYFTGRAEQLRALDEVLQHDGAPLVALVCGHGGIGKTSLAIQWAHAAAHRFPDGQLFVDARGHDRTTALTPLEIASVLLRCLGVPDDRVPHGLDERLGLYRSMLAGKRMLIVLDNAGATEQVSPLIPSHAGSLLLVTSRNSLAALVTHVEVRQIVLDALSEGESADLLTKVLGAQRAGREPQAVSRLARLCGRMPLALRIAAAKLATQPGKAIEALADEVSGEDRLAHLSVEGEARTVEAVFVTAYQSLSEPARTLFRRLGRHPGPHVAAPLAAAVCGVSTVDLAPALTELVAAHLIAEPQPGRFRLHDLIRLFARRCYERDEPAPAACEAAERMLDWYLTVAQAAREVLDKSLNRMSATLRHPAPQLPFPAEHEPVLAFLESERDNLVAIVRYAGEHGQQAAACQLTYLLEAFFVARGHWPERIEMCRHAVRAAQELGDPGMEAEMHRALGIAYRASFRLGEAIDSHLRALPLLRELGDERGLAYLYNSIGGANAELRHFAEAVEAYEMSLRLHTRTGNAFGAVTAHRNLGYVHMRTGELERSLAHLGQALDSARAIGYRRLEAGTLASLGTVHRLLEEHDRSIECLHSALAVSRDIGDLRCEMDTLGNLGKTHLAQGKPLPAAEVFGEALALSRRLGHHHAEARTLTHLADAHLLQGDHEVAARHLDASAQLREGVADAYEEAQLQRCLGDLAHATGRAADAMSHWERAIDLFLKAHASAEADRLRDRLTATGLSPAVG